MSKLCASLLLGLPFSRNDTASRIRIPERVLETLDEEIGIHLGDQHPKLRRPIPGGAKRRCIYFGHNLETCECPLSHVAGAVAELHNVQVSVDERLQKSEPNLTYCLKAEFYFKSKVVGIPVGPQSNAHLRRILLESDNDCLHSDRLRRPIDTDSSLSFGISGKGEYSEPILNFSTSSPPLTEDCTHPLTKLRFRFCRSLCKRGGSSRLKKDLSR
jgi:hypothetical protein